MKNSLKIIYHISRLILAAVFIYSGAVKAQDIIGFAGEIANYQLFPYACNYLFAAILPYLELLCGVLLLLNRRVRPVVLILTVMDIIFIGAISSAIIRGLDIGCGCFSPETASENSLIIALWRDIGLLILLVATWILYRSCKLKKD